jgi:hypothetical protein
MEAGRGSVESRRGATRPDVEDREGIKAVDADLDDEIVLRQHEEFHVVLDVVDDGVIGEHVPVRDRENDPVGDVPLGLGGVHGPVAEKIQARGHREQ